MNPASGKLGIHDSVPSGTHELLLTPDIDWTSSKFPEGRPTIRVLERMLGLRMLTDPRDRLDFDFRAIHGP